MYNNAEGRGGRIHSSCIRVQGLHKRIHAVLPSGRNKSLEEVMERDREYLCGDFRYALQRGLSVHHRRPQSVGGKNDTGVIISWNTERRKNVEENVKTAVLLPKPFRLC